MIRAIDGDADWAAVTAAQVAQLTAFGPGCEACARGQVDAHHRLVGRGHGSWFGAFAGEGEAAPLAADLGIFVADGVGWFQTVETASSFLSTPRDLRHFGAVGPRSRDAEAPATRGPAQPPAASRWVRTQAARSAQRVMARASLGAA